MRHENKLFSQKFYRRSILTLYSNVGIIKTFFIRYKRFKNDYEASILGAINLVSKMLVSFRDETAAPRQGVIRFLKSLKDVGSKPKTGGVP